MTAAAEQVSEQKEMIADVSLKMTMSQSALAALTRERDRLLVCTRVAIR